jgi:hypothetical protein
VAASARTGAEALLGEGFLFGPPRTFISRSKVIHIWNTCVEAGSNTSTVTLRVIGGDEKGSLECETVKYGHESYGTRTRK